MHEHAEAELNAVRDKQDGEGAPDHHPAIEKPLLSRGELSGSRSLFFAEP